MSFSIAFEYKYINKFNFNPNIFSLSKIYSAFLSTDAIALYVYMSEELKNIKTISIFKNKINEILSLLKFDETRFNLAKQNLEKIGLLKSYISDDSKIFFELFEPLKLSDFLKFNFFSTKIESIISKDLLNKIKLQFEGFEIPDNLKDISTKSEITQLNNSNNTVFDFDKLYKKLNSLSTKKFIFEEQSKNIIQQYFRKNIFSFHEIEEIIYNCISENGDDYFIEFQKLNKYLYEMSNKKNSMISDSSNEKKVEFCETDYDNFNFFDYYENLTCEKLLDEEIKIIKKIKNKFNFTDGVINVMILYSLKKTYGKINENYLNKLGKSLKINNINNSYSALEYLNFKSFKNLKNESKIEKLEFENKNNNISNNNLELGDESYIEIPDFIFG